MRFLMVADSFHPEVGGSEVFNLELSAALVRRGHQVWVLSRRLSNWACEEEVRGIQVLRYPLDYRNWPTVFYSSLRSLPQAYASLPQRFSPDCIVFHHAVSAFPLLLRGLAGVPKILIFYAPIDDEYREEARGKMLRMRGLLSCVLYRLYSSLIASLLGWMHRFDLGRVERVVVWSRYSQALLRQMGIPEEMIAFLPGGVDLDRFHPVADRDGLKASLGLPQDRPLLLTVRRLAPRMGLENLLHAFGLVLEAGERAYLVIGGTGELGAPLVELSRELGLEENTLFAGFIAEDRLPLFYRAADLFILPSLGLEGLGLVTIEALASGTPVLGTALGATPEILTTLDSRLLFRDATPEAMAQGIRAFLHDAGLRSEAFRHCCRRYVEENYSWERAAAAFEILCEALVGARA